MNANGDPNSNANTSPSGGNNDWNDLNKIKDAEKQAKTFTSRELERIADLTGRPVDDEEVIKLNLALRFQEYNRQKEMYDEYVVQKSGYLQQGAMEDIATAKRELEEAMYLYDDRFAKKDDEIAGLDEDLKRRNMADKAMNSGQIHDKSWVHGILERKKVFAEKTKRVEDERAEVTEKLWMQLPDIAEDIEETEIYKTYQSRNTGGPAIQERRAGFNDVGKEGFYGEKHEIDWTLHPHPPMEADPDAKDDVDPSKDPDADPNTDPDAKPDDDPNKDGDDGDDDEKEYKPLSGTVFNIDFEHDKKEVARDVAEQELNADVAKSGFFKQIWKGQLFKKYYLKKYEGELLSGERKVTTMGEGIESLDDVIDTRAGGTVERFVMGVMDDPETSAFIHRHIGGKNQGEKLSEADAELTGLLRGAIEKFAKEDIPEGGNLDDLKLAFMNEISRIQAEKSDNGEKVNKKLADTYYEMAVQARECVEHGMAMERVMEGFKVYNAEARSGVRSEVHRDKIDKLVNKFESSKLGQFVPPEILAGAIGSAAALTQLGAQMASGAVGGIVLSGVFAGLKERNRVTEDRTRMLRDAAMGMEYSGTSGEDLEGMSRAEKKRAKYEAKLGGTLYELKPASELIEGIRKARESGNSKAILEAIAAARVRIDFSDVQQKDLIAFSSTEKMSDERFELDKTLIEAEQSLSDEDKNKLGTMFAVVRKEITESVDEKDANFRKVRAAQAAWQAGKTIAVGALMFAGTQELTAALSPGKVGLLEKWGILKTQNAQNAEETILARVLGPRGTTGEVRFTSDPAEMEALRKQGYEGTKIKDAHTELQTTTENVPSSEVKGIKVEKGWLDNGTKVSDGNELRLHTSRDAIRFRPNGNSTLGSQTYNPAQLAQNGQLKGLINVNGADFLVEGQWVNGEMIFPIDAAGNITTTTGEVISAVGPNGEKMFRTFSAVADMGTKNGITKTLSFATEVGPKTFNGTITKTVTAPVEKAAEYAFARAPEMWLGGPAVGVANRVGLGEARARAVPTQEPRAGDAANTGEPAPVGGQAGEITGADEEARKQAQIDEILRLQEEAKKQAQIDEILRLQEEARKQALIDEVLRLQNGGSEPIKPIEPLPEPETVAEIRDREFNFWQAIGEDGAEIMQMNDELGNDNVEKINQWLENLDDNARRMLPEYKLVMGRTLRRKLQQDGILPSDREIGLKEDGISSEADQDYIDSRYYDWVDQIGKEGLELMNSTEELDDQMRDRIERWYFGNGSRPGVPDETREFILDDLRAGGYGRALRQWLEEGGDLRNPFENNAE